eukprot:8057467-Pyramimonas_sp.AAC.2
MSLSPVTCDGSPNPVPPFTTRTPLITNSREKARSPRNVFLSRRDATTGVSFGRQWLTTFGTSRASEKGAHSPHGPNRHRQTVLFLFSFLYIPGAERDADRAGVAGVAATGGAVRGPVPGDQRVAGAVHLAAAHGRGRAALWGGPVDVAEGRLHDH